jgi:hypothetical protein
MADLGYSVVYIEIDLYNIVRRRASEEGLKITRLVNDIFRAGLRVKRMLPSEEQPIPQEAA